MEIGEFKTNIKKPKMKSTRRNGGKENDNRWGKRDVEKTMRVWSW
jgi:hypothetical protein